MEAEDQSETEEEENPGKSSTASVEWHKVDYAYPKFKKNKKLQVEIILKIIEISKTDENCKLTNKTVSANFKLYENFKKCSKQCHKEIAVPGAMD